MLRVGPAQVSVSPSAAAASPESEHPTVSTSRRPSSGTRTASKVSSDRCCHGKSRRLFMVMKQKMEHGIGRKRARHASDGQEDSTNINGLSELSCMSEIKYNGTFHAKLASPGVPIQVQLQNHSISVSLLHSFCGGSSSSAGGAIEVPCSCRLRLSFSFDVRS